MVKWLYCELDDFGFPIFAYIVLGLYIVLGHHSCFYVIHYLKDKKVSSNREGRANERIQACIF